MAAARARGVQMLGRYVGGALGMAVFSATAVLAAAAPAPAPAAVTVGPDPLPARTGVISIAGATIFTNRAVPGATLAAPSNGVLTKWRVRRGSGGGLMSADTLTLRVLRPTGTQDEFTAQGTSEAHAVPGGTAD
ncbi:MAG: hypothetical protein ACR2N5_00155, partial [Solirubrobacterales bacterium]